MHVVVPDILVAVGLVVLTRRYTITAEGVPHREGRRTDGSLKGFAELDWKVVHVLVVTIRDDQYGTRVPRPPLGVHLDEDAVVAVYELERQIGLAGSQVAAEGTAIARRGVVVHPVIVVEDVRAVIFSCRTRRSAVAPERRGPSAHVGGRGRGPGKMSP